MIFFCPNNKKTKSIKKFVEIYSNVYYYVNRGYKRKVEIEIDKILSREMTFTKNDLGTILAWKTGNMYDSKKEAVVTKSVKNVVIDVKQVWIDIEKLVEKWEKEHNGNGAEPFCMEEQQDCIQLLRALTEKENNGVGMVYAITILYFLSKGRYPIFDKYSCVALDAITGEKGLESEVNYCELSTSASIAFNKDYWEFYKKMTGIFKENYIHRDVDRALWAYGHMFTINAMGRKEKQSAN